MDTIHFDANPTIIKRGIILKRRDKSALTHKIYSKILDIILRRGELCEAIDVLVSSVQDLLNGKISYEDLIITKEFKDNYRSNNSHVKIFVGKLRKDGKIVNPGDHLEFIVIENKNLVSIEEYLENKDKIDYQYYLEELMGPIDQLFQVGFREAIDKLQFFKYEPNGVLLDHPLQTILNMIEKGDDLEEFKKVVHQSTTKLKMLLRDCDPISLEEIHSIDIIQ